MDSVLCKWTCRRFSLSLTTKRSSVDGHWERIVLARAHTYPEQQWCALFLSGEAASLRSIPYIAAQETCLFLPSPAARVAVKSTIWAYAEPQQTRSDVSWQKTIADSDGHSFPQRSAWPPCWTYKKLHFLSQSCSCSAKKKRRRMRLRFSAWLGCVSHGKDSKTLNMLLLAHAQSTPLRPVCHVSMTILNSFITPKLGSRMKWFCV